MTDRLHLATGTAEVLASLRASLAGGDVTAPLPTDGPERQQALAMLRPEVAVDQADAGAIVATSGSTGHPRGVVLPRSALVASAEATHRRLGGPGTWVLALPVHYVAGLMVLVRSLVADRPVLEVDSRLAGLAGLAGLADLARTTDPLYLSVVPTQLARALSNPEIAAALTRCSAILVGGAALDQELRDRAMDAGVKIVSTYGMSETCGGCVYDGVPLEGVDVAVGADDRISIGGPMVLAGYRCDGSATAEALVGGRLLTRDRGLLIDGRLTVLGRIDDVVISGGMNVDLAAVERAVRTWTGVEAAVVGVPHPERGAEVVAVVESSEPSALVDLRAALAPTFPPYAIPRRLVVREQLPRTSGGKIDRRRLVAELGDRPEEHQ